MKKLLLSLALILVCTGARAEAINFRETIDKIPAINNGVAYSFVDHRLNYLGTIKLVSWRGFNLEAGYAGDSDATDHKFVGVVSYDLFKLRDMGVTVPVLDLIEFNPGIYFGAGKVNIKEMDESETDWGVSATIVKFKF